MDTLEDPENYVGFQVTVSPDPEDEFTQEFSGVVIGVRNGLLQVRDADDDVFEVESKQVTKDI